MSRKIPVKCICPVCGKEFLTKRPKKPTQACSPKCACEKRRKNYIMKYGHPNHNKTNNYEKAKQTCLKKYGCENPSQILEIKQKKEETCKKHYGTDYFVQSEEGKEKIKQTCLKKYGHECVFQAEKIKEKIKQTNLIKYGKESHNSSEIVKEHKKESCLKKYGYEYTFQNPEVKEKIKNVSIKKYGIENPGGSEKAIKKSKQTKLERYGNENFTNRKKALKTLIENGNYNKSDLENFIYELLLRKNFKIIRQYSSEKYPWLCDFYIEDLQLYIEIQGYPSHGKHGNKIYGPYNKNNPEHQNLLKSWQEKAEHNDWYKTAIKIWTQEDPLKRETAKINNLNWIEFFTLEDFLRRYLNL